MKRLLKIAGLSLLAILALAGVYVAWNFRALSAFPALPSGYEAKELCSCLFVEGRSEADCEAFIRQTVVPIEGRHIDKDKRSVRVTALWTTRRASFVSERYGCVLDGEPASK
jgi:hypothetical protein